MNKIEVPGRMKHLPVAENGFVVPWFVHWEDEDTPEFRIIGDKKLWKAARKKLCWVCGKTMNTPINSFVIGPMCAVNHVSSEPPSHRECAEYSAQMCPFLVNPKKRRREHGIEEKPVAGIMIERNPGVALVYSSRTWHSFRAPNGILFDIGQPVRVSWWAEGRAATRDEVMTSIETGLPTVYEMAVKDGPQAVALLSQQVRRALPLLPTDDLPTELEQEVSELMEKVGA